MSESLPAPDRTLFRPLRAVDVHVLASPVRLARLYPTSGPYPSAWNVFRAVGPLASGRFDHHEPGTARGIWYGAASRTPIGRHVDAVLGAVAETFADTFTIDRSVAGRYLALCLPGRPLRLLRLDSGWLASARGNAAIFAGPRPRAQAWSRAVYAHYPDLDGMVYPSSNHPVSTCVALFERAADALVEPALLVSLREAGLAPYLERIAGELGWPLV